MSLAFNIAKCVAWASGLATPEDWSRWQKGLLVMQAELALPPLADIPAMQRRRLSPFAKIALHCAIEASGSAQSDIPVVFSSRHGDLHRTTGLIEDIAQGKDLSPTQFGLSVHNAAVGLFSIFSGNQAPISAIAAGQSSFMVGLIDSVAKLKANKLPRILYVYCDLVVPECYSQYVEHDVSIGIGLLIEAAQTPSAMFQLTQSQTEAATHSDHQALDFMKFYMGDETQYVATVNQQLWQLNRNDKVQSSGI
ncbi:beta-ketoacyl synthase chain length factor [Paraglaciecola hydrolytica]|uniref:Beta-ketoacyl synthase-like N-terminal domain-containing protein n=1 Tax=Paraglaciecola hydrolytica TaxID=1799789 RepID=A0A136A281_9ALTE|nr:beta-ketoacyl synthase chain length factor [Paraglaciecola hydrolytica]KXI29331.1 hypothetical protein AX660_14410 [Paraglaciecola hydrolytica]